MKRRTRKKRQHRFDKSLSKKITRFRKLGLELDSAMPTKAEYNEYLRLKRKAEKSYFRKGVK